MRTVDIVVPCYNEAEMLEMFHERVSQIVGEVPGYEFTFYLVDDGSRDETLSIMERLAEKDKRVKYISFSRNFGKESAMYAGLKATTGDLVVLIDADLQHPPELIPQMIRAIDEEGYDTCSARRVSREGEPKIRSWFARAFYKLINRMSEVEIVDGAVDFRMMNRAMADAILELPEVQRFSKGIFSWVGFKTKWIEFKNIERIAGETKWSFWSLLKYAISGITAFTTVPLRLATVCGVVISASAFIYLLVELIKNLITRSDVPGYASTIILILFIGGITILFCGIMGEYIARMYMETKRRPIFITRRTNIERKKAEEAEHGRSN